MSDNVNSPAHYTDSKSGIECITITRHMNFNIGNAIKYLWRHGKKDKSKTIEDLQKAVFYINDEIERLKKWVYFIVIMINAKKIAKEKRLMFIQ